MKYLSEAVEEEFEFHIVVRQSNVLLIVAENTPDRNQKWNPTIGYGPGPFADLPGHPRSKPKKWTPTIASGTGPFVDLDQLSGLQKGRGLVVGVSVVLKWRVYLTIKIWMVSDHLKYYKLFCENLELLLLVESTKLSWIDRNTYMV